LLATYNNFTNYNYTYVTNSTYEQYIFTGTIIALFILIIAFNIILFVYFVINVYNLLLDFTKLFRYIYINSIYSINTVIDSTIGQNNNDESSVVNNYINEYNSEDEDTIEDTIEDTNRSKFQGDYLLIRLKNMHSSKCKRYITSNPITTRSKKQKYN